MADNHNNYDHSHGGDRDSQSMNPEHGNNKSMQRINDKSQGNPGTVSPRNQERHQQVSTNPSLSSGVNISPGGGVPPYHYSANISPGQQAGNVQEFIPRGVSGMHYDGQGQGQGQGLTQTQGQGGLGPGQQVGGGQGQGYPQQPQHYQPYVSYPPNQVIGYGQQPHHPYHPQMVSGVRQVPTQQLQQQSHYQPHPGVVQGHEMNMMHPQQQQQLQQQHGTRSRVEDRGGAGGGVENYQNYINNIPRNMPPTMPAYAPNGVPIPIPIPYRGNMSASISDYPYDATYGSNPLVNQGGGYYAAVPLQNVIMSTTSSTGGGEVPILVPIASNTTLENMTNERLVALAKSNEQHKVVSEMLLKTAQSDLANTRKKVEELTLQLDGVRRELVTEKAINESRKILESEKAAISVAHAQTDFNSNQKEVMRSSEEYCNGKQQEERMIASNDLQREWERDADECQVEATGKAALVKKDMNKEKDKSTSGRPTDSAATILVKSVLLTPRSPVNAPNAEPAKAPSGSQRMWADVEDEEEEEGKAPASAQGQGQGQAQRPQGGVYSRVQAEGQGQGQGPMKGGGSMDANSFKSGRDKETSGQYGAGRGSKTGPSPNSYDGDRGRGFDRENRESSYGGDHTTTFGGRGAGDGRGQSGGRGSSSMGGRGPADRGSGSIGSGGGNVARPLRPTKIIPPTPQIANRASQVNAAAEQERDASVPVQRSSSPAFTRTMNGTSSISSNSYNSGSSNNNSINNSNTDNSSSSGNKKLNSDPTTEVRGTKSPIFGGPPNPSPSFTRSITATFASRDVRVLDAANAANANTNSSNSNTNSNLESPTRRKGPPAQFISNSPERENSNSKSKSKSRLLDVSDDYAATEGNREDGDEKKGGVEDEASTEEGNLKMSVAAMKAKKAVKPLRPTGRDGGRGDGWRGSGTGRGRGRDDDRRSGAGYDNGGGRGNAMKIPPPYYATYHREKENESSAHTVPSTGPSTAETERDRHEPARSSSAMAGANMDGSICRFYSKGFCRFGADCNNYHSGPVVKSTNRPRADSAPEGEASVDEAPKRRQDAERREKGALSGRGWGGRESGGSDAGRDSKGRGRGGRRPHTSSFDASSSDVPSTAATNISATDSLTQSGQGVRSEATSSIAAVSTVSMTTGGGASAGAEKVVVAAVSMPSATEAHIASE